MSNINVFSNEEDSKYGKLAMNILLFTKTIPCDRQVDKNGTVYDVWEIEADQVREMGLSADIDKSKLMEYFPPLVLTNMKYFGFSVKNPDKFVIKYISGKVRVFSKFHKKSQEVDDGDEN